MLIYIFKSAACMAIFFVFYKLLMERENMHVFKRFYLLLALGASLVIPALVFTEYVVVEPVTPTEVNYTTVSDTDYIGVPQALENDVLDIEPILWSVYFLGLIFFGFRFIRNLFQIFRRVRKNPKQKSSSFIQVLLKENYPPHTFFKYIFLNKKKLEANEIPKEVLLHEETHARQKHSWDVVLIELLQVIFWFNPLVYLFKKAIKLNHEFLADQAVLDKDIDETTYQNTLLSYLSPDSEKKYQSELANAINYSSIKKRFTVMKTHTSKKAVLLRSLLLLPLLALLLYGFSETKIIQKKVNASANTGKVINITSNIIRIYINKKQEITLNEKFIAVERISKKIVEIIDSSGIKTNSPQEIYIEAEGNLNIKLLESIKEQISEAGGVLTLVTADTIKGMNKTFEEKYAGIRFRAKDTLYIEQENGKSILGVSSKENTLGSKKKIYTKSNQDGASRELMKEYNGLAKKYNTMLRESKSIQIKKKDVERLEYIYGLMSDKQKADAEPFPDFPEPPPPPKAPKTAKAPQVKKGEKSNIPPPPPSANLTDEEFAEKVIDETIANQDPYDHGNQLKVFKNEDGTFTAAPIRPSGFNIDDIPPPPAPPEPQSPLDHVIEMAKKGATFYYEGKEVNSDEAIELLKNDESLNIDSRGHKTKHPEVRISKKPYYH